MEEGGEKDEVTNRKKTLLGNWQRSRKNQIITSCPAEELLTRIYFSSTPARPDVNASPLLPCLHTLLSGSHTLNSVYLRHWKEPFRACALSFTQTDRQTHTAVAELKPV